MSEVAAAFFTRKGFTEVDHGAIPPIKWDGYDADRLAQARAALGQFAQARSIPIENILSPDSIRRVLWSPPADSTIDSVAEALRALGARQWQVDIVCPILEEAINRPAETPAPAETPVDVTHQ